MKNVLIIGHTGGIGRALADHYRAQGAQITGVSRTTHGLDYMNPASIDTAIAQLDGPFDRVIVASGALEIDGYAPEKTIQAGLYRFFGCIAVDFQCATCYDHAIKGAIKLCDRGIDRRRVHIIQTMGRARNTCNLRALRAVVICQCATDPACMSNYQNILHANRTRGACATIKRLLCCLLAHLGYLR